MVLGLDVSTQSISALVVDINTKKVNAEVSVNFGECLPAYSAPSGFYEGTGGEVFANPLMWLEALDLLLSELQSMGVDLSKVRVISGAAQQHATVYLNHTFKNTLANLSSEKSLKENLKSTLSRKESPIWMDSSTTSEVSEISNALNGDDQVCELSGSVSTARFAGPQIRKFSKNLPEAYESTDIIHLASSFFASIFGGVNASIDWSDGAGMNLMNLSRCDWDENLLAATAPNLLEKLPLLEKSGSVLGTVSKYFVEKYGFATSCEVTNWMGDNPASLVGMGASSPGNVVISLGTSDTMFAAMPEAIADPSGCGHVFANPMGGYMSLTCFANGSLAREKVKDDLGVSWTQFESLLSTEFLSENTSEIAFPAFVAETSPKLRAAGVLTNGWNYEEADQSVRARSIVEGQFINMKLQSEWMHLNIQQILLTGGASRNTGIAQIIANVFQSTVVRRSVSSSVALGAAQLAASAVGVDILSDLEVNASCDLVQPNKSAGECDRGEQIIKEILLKSACLLK